MKKLGALLIITSLLIIPLFLQIAVSQRGSDEDTPGLPDALENPEGTIENIRNTTSTKWEYLNEEWQKIITESKFWNPIFKVLNPLIKAFTGYEFSVTPTFLIAAILSFIIFLAFFDGIRLYYKQPFISIPVAFLVVIIASSAGLTRKVVPKIEILLDNKWKLIIFIAIAAILIVAIEYIARYIKKKRTEGAMENLPETEEKIQKAGEKLSSVVKGMKNVKEGYESGRGI